MKQRIVTGLILAAAAVVLILVSPPGLFAVLILAVLLVASLEWCRLVVAAEKNFSARHAGEKKAGENPPGEKTYSRTYFNLSLTVIVAIVIAALLAYALLAMAMMMVFYTPEYLPILPIFCWAGIAFWLYQAIGLAKKSPTIPSPPTPFTTLYQGGCIFLFAFAALMLMRLEPNGKAMMISMLLVVASADVFAYLIGKSLGRRKLAPTISPGKTVEGLLGGIIGGGVAAWLTAMLLELNAAQTIAWLLAALAATGFSVVGDLFESQLKRRAGVKHSGGLLPGHGGVLDRIDGLLAAAPVFVGVWRLTA